MSLAGKRLTMFTYFFFLTFKVQAVAIPTHGELLFLVNEHGEPLAENYSELPDEVTAVGEFMTSLQKTGRISMLSRVIKVEDVCHREVRGLKIFLGASESPEPPAQAENVQRRIINSGLLGHFNDRWIFLLCSEKKERNLLKQYLETPGPDQGPLLITRFQTDPFVESALDEYVIKGYLLSKQNRPEEDEGKPTISEVFSSTEDFYPEQPGLFTRAYHRVMGGGDS